MIIAVPKETFPGERRVALVPAGVPRVVEKRRAACRSKPGAGEAAGFTDDAYRAAGAEIVGDRRQLFQSADVVLQVRGLGANPQAGAADLELMRDRPGDHRAVRSAGQSGGGASDWPSAA